MGARKNPVTGQTILLAMAIVALVLAAYVPAMRAGYVWDDDQYLTANPLIAAHNGLGRIWLSLDSPSQYFPLVYTMFRAEHALWGFSPAGYHVINIVLHAINALLIWLLLGRLRIRGAWLAAAIWALHPVNVESVAWITERKNTLSTLLYLLSLLAWDRYVDPERGGRRLYVLSLAACAFALFAKTTACTIPAALLIVLWVKRLPVDKRRIWQILPYAVLGAAMGIISMWWEHNHQGTFGPEFAFSPLQRLLIASRAVCFYVGKLLCPGQLCFSYPLWKIDVGEPAQYVWLMVTIAAVVLLWMNRARWRGAAAALVFFVAMLAPMLGFISLYTFRYSFVADHYQYFACLGPIAVFAGLVSSRFAGRRSSFAAAALLLVVLGAMTWRQAEVYSSEETLWRDVLRKNPASFLACNDLGAVLFKRGQVRQGIALQRKSVQLNPRHWEAHLNVGMEDYRRGDFVSAERHYRAVVRYAPGHSPGHFYLGLMHMKFGRLDQAVREYQQAIKCNPAYEPPHLELAKILEARGEFGEAAVEWDAALSISPSNARAHYGRGTCYAQAGDVASAIPEFQEAVRLKPRWAAARSDLGVALLQSGQFDSAADQLEEALRLQPALGPVHGNLAVAYYQIGNYAGAWRQVRLARQAGVGVNPGFLKALAARQPQP